MYLAHHELESVTIIIVTGLPEQPSMCPAYDGKISRACTEYIFSQDCGENNLHAMLQPKQSGGTPPCVWHAWPCQCNAVQRHECAWHQLQLQGSPGLPCPRSDVCKGPLVVNHDMPVHTQSVQTRIGGALQVHAWYFHTQASCCRSRYI